MAKKKHKGHILKSIEKLLASEAAFSSEYLEDNGMNASEVGKKGADFVKQLIDTKKRTVFFKRQEKQIDWTHPSVLKLLKENKSQPQDPIQLVKEKCRQLVLDAFNRGWTGPPFDVIELAKLSGIQIAPYELVTDARISPIKDKFKIEYNPFQSPARINFSIAHEIGHTLFSDCADTIRYRESKIEKSSWELEFLCNVAAAELLLPYAEFSNEANEVDLNINSIIGLARKYNASVESVFLRFCEVVERPCTMALASFKDNGLLEVDYSKSSAISDLTFNRGFIIPKESKVYECKKTGWTSHGLESWKVFNNKKYRVYGVGLSPIKRQSTPRVGIFFVPEVFDNSPSKSIYIVNGDATLPRGDGKKIIGQVINTSGGLGFGFGRALATRYPETKKSVQEWKKDKKKFRLGNSQLVDISENLFVYQMLAQEGIKEKHGSVPLKYPSLRACLNSLYQVALDLGASIHIPAIGAGQAKGDWNIIKGMIYDEIVRRGVDVTIYLLPGTNMAPNQSRTLTLYKEDEK
jgi:O-acetyl-ADP-ribose deacetylase (regulator of RNase III)